MSQDLSSPPAPPPLSLYTLPPMWLPEGLHRSKDYGAVWIVTCCCLTKLLALTHVIGWHLD
jgi:hypothetical protein